jgi:hypothetical protein
MVVERLQVMTEAFKVVRLGPTSQSSPYKGEGITPSRSHSYATQPSVINLSENVARPLFWEDYYSALIAFALGFCSNLRITRKRHVNNATLGWRHRFETVFTTA